MIGYLRGNAIETAEKYTIIDVHGVGYLVYMIPSQIPQIGNEVALHIETVVREDSLELFGFKDKMTKDFFVKLIGISGIGPRGALGILALAPVETLIKAIIRGDGAFLTKVSGIGKKTGEKIILELRDKMDNGNLNEDTRVSDDVFDALAALGYSPAEIREALANLTEETLTQDTQSIIRAVLSWMRKN